MPSVKKNFFYNSILTCANYVFPFLTFPYVSRVLGVTNIGICNFVDGIVHYFILFSMLGISVTGIREIAAVKNDREKLNRTFTNLFLLNTISTSIVAFTLLICIFVVPQFREYKTIFFISFIKLIGNYLLIEWLYKGLENFRYITIRSIIVKCCYVIGVFIFVRKSTDYPVYFLLMCLMWALNAVFNVSYARKLISLSFKHISIRPYVKSFFTLGLYMILTSMYTTFNVAYLGFVAGVKEVGYYTTATKIYSVIVALFSAFTNVMLPRMSSLLSENHFDKFKSMLIKSVDALLFLSIPAIILLTVYAPQVIRIIAGAGYGGAILPMRIVIPLVFVIGYEQILVIQILMPLKKDRYIFINSVIGAVVGLLLNVALISSLKSVGAACVWVSSELAVLLSAQYFVNRSVNMGFPIKRLLLNIAIAMPAVVIAVVFYMLPMHMLLQLTLGSLLALIYWVLAQTYIIKNAVLIDILKKYNLIYTYI